MEPVSKCRAAQIEAIKVVKHNGHRQGIKPIRTGGWYVRPAPRKRGKTCVSF